MRRRKEGQLEREMKSRRMGGTKEEGELTGGERGSSLALLGERKLDIANFWSLLLSEFPVSKD